MAAKIIRFPCYIPKKERLTIPSVKPQVPYNGRADQLDCLQIQPKFSMKTFGKLVLIEQLDYSESGWYVS